MANRNTVLENSTPSNHSGLLDQMFDRVSGLVMEVITSGLNEAPRFVITAVREAFENSGILDPDDKDDASMESEGPPAAPVESGTFSGSGLPSEEISDGDQLSRTESLDTVEKTQKIIELFEDIESLCRGLFEKSDTEQAANVDDVDKMEE